MSITPEQIEFQSPYAAQKNPGANSSAAFVLVINRGDTSVNITGWVSSTVPMVMPMYFGLDQEGVWRMINVPSGKVNVDPGVPTLFYPGYLHIMLMNLSCSLPASFDITFTISPDSGDEFTKTVTFKTIEWTQMNATKILI